MSKIMHEAAFKELGLNHTYGLYDVQEADLKLFMEDADFKGLNITIPLKTAAVQYMDELSKEAVIIGSINTVEFADDKLIGYNTDVLGFMKCLQEADVDVKNKNFLILGAGGAGRGIVFKLAMEHHRVYSYDTDSEKSSKLCKDVLQKVGVKVEQAQDISDIIGNVDILVNATPVGMHPNIEKTPLVSKYLSPAITVVDIVYNPVETRLLRQARERGCDTVSGIGMLVHQGAEALKIWLDVEPPIEVMKKAVLRKL